MTTPEPDPQPVDESASPKPRRKRRTRAEIEAERAEKIAAVTSESLFAPEIWMILGGALLVTGAFIYFDPASFAQAGQPSDDTWLRTLFVLLVGIFGKNPTAITLIALGLLSLIWGVRGWLKAHLEARQKPDRS